MELRLKRFGSIPNQGTFGFLEGDDIGLVTIEREWRDNRPLLSCVPDGKYALEPHHSQKEFIGDTWALVNPELGVFHYDHPEAIRTTILIHVANVQTQLQGCIGVGEKFGAVGDKFGVWNSRKAMDRLRKALPQANFLEIRWA